MNILLNLGILRNLAGNDKTRPSLRTMISVAKERQALKSLPTQRLNDIGYTANEALTEANRPMWDVPRHWKR